jgi:hypothetical protein
MKWLVALVLVLLPLSAAAQNSTEIDPASLGDGWQLSVSERQGGLTLPWAHRTVYVGPSGSTIVIQAVTIGASIAQISATYSSVNTAWSSEAVKVAATDTGLPDLDESDWTDAPKSVTDMKRVEGVNKTNGLFVGSGLYGSLAGEVVILIRTEGTVNGLTGVAATDYVAGLYFAALSAE